MENLKFKTNIKCSGCIATVTPFLNKTVGENNWQVDLQAPEKVLTVQATDKEKETQVIQSLKEAGYHAEKIS
jgi:copper chaperone